MKSISPRIGLALAAGILFALCAPATQAGGVNWSVNVGVPVAPVYVAPPVVYAPQPVVVQPQPVLVAPAPIVPYATVYYYDAFGRPVYVAPRRHWRHRHHD